MNYKVVFALVAMLLLAGPSFAAPLLKVQHSSIAAQKKVGLDMCPFCVQTIGQIINQLLNIIINVGIVGTCGELCGLLPLQLEAVACNLLCDIVGIKEFINIIEKADLDPIYFCELLDHQCPVHDCSGSSCAQISGTNISPKSGPQGTEFSIEVSVTGLNQTSTGTIAVDIFPPAPGFPFGDAELVPTGFQPGQVYQVRLGLKAEPSEQEPFSPGTYKVQFAACEGECGSKHPHSEVYAVANDSFQITA